MTKLPSGWAESTLGEIGEYLNGRGFKKTEWRETGRPIIRIQNLTGTSSAFNYFDGEPEEHYVARAGDILVSWAATLDVFVWRGPEAVVNQHIFKVRSHVNHDFHHYLLLSVLDDLRRETHGSGMVHITKGRFEDTPVQLPTLDEQARIVAALEEQFSRLDAGVAALERARRNLMRMRASVREAAVAGMLSSDTQASRTKAGLPDGWSWQPLEAIITRLRNGVFVSRPGIDVTERPILRISAVRPMALNVADVRYVPRAVEMDPDGSFVLEPGDLLFTRYSGNPEYVGACAMVPAQAPRLLYPDKLIRVQVDRALVDPRFVEIAANAGETRRVIRSRVKTTAGQTGISGSDLKSVPFPVPPLTVQQRIVDEVDTALAPTKRLGEQLDLMLRRSSSLRATTLVSAFSGKLVPQDPNDEPASVLLERISAERATSNGHRPTTARSRRKIAT